MCKGIANRMKDKHFALWNSFFIALDSCLTAMFAMFSMRLVSMLRPLLGWRKRLRWRCVILYGMALHWRLLVRTQAVEQTSPSSQRFGRPNPHCCRYPNDEGHEKSQQEDPQTWPRLVTRHRWNHKPFVTWPVLVKQACHHTGGWYCVQYPEHTQANRHHLEFNSFGVASCSSCVDFYRSRTTAKECQETDEE
jgi:hypothetical protein